MEDVIQTLKLGTYYTPYLTSGMNTVSPLYSSTVAYRPLRHQGCDQDSDR